MSAAADLSSAARPTDYEVRYQEILSSGAPPMPALLGTLNLLGPGELLVLRIDFEPALLLRVLAGRGFDARTEGVPGKNLSIYFSRRPAAKPRLFSKLDERAGEKHII